MKWKSSSNKSKFGLLSLAILLFCCFCLCFLCCNPVKPGLYSAIEAHILNFSWPNMVKWHNSGIKNKFILFICYWFIFCLFLGFACEDCLLLLVCWWVSVLLQQQSFLLIMTLQLFSSALQLKLKSEHLLICLSCNLVCLTGMSWACHITLMLI